MATSCKILLAIAFVSAYLAQDSQCQSSILDVDGFRLKTRVIIVRPNSTGIGELTTNEYYSNLERRSRLDLEIRDGDRKPSAKSKFVQYFYDATPKERAPLLRLTSGLLADCTKVEAQKLADDLFGVMSSSDAYLTDMDWLKERQDVPDYLIGFSRLLAIVEANRNRMLPSRKNFTALIRNQEADRYIMNDPLGSKSFNEQNVLTIYYGVSQDPTKNIPLRIWYLQSKTDAEILVDFSRFEIMGQETFGANADFAGAHHSSLMFPLDSGCSSQLPATNLISDRPAPALVSFRMTLDSAAGQKYFVAYDGYSSALRRDEIDDRKDEASVTTIYDLRLQRKYSVKKNQGQLASELSQSIGKGSQCAVTRISPDQKVQVEPIIPFKGMARMGMATVKGVKAVVFEQPDDKIPEIFKPKANNAGDFREVKYSVIYYFASETSASNGTHTKSPMQVEEHQQVGPLLKIRAVKKGVTYYEIDFEEFQWQLTDAPNGDRSSELFALDDTCYGDKLNSETLATLSLELSADLGAQMKPVDLEMMYSMLNCSVKRNIGLARALSVRGLAATQIYDLESRVYKRKSSEENSVGIRAIAKINHQNRVPYEAVTVGAGMWHVGTETTSARSFDSCLLDAVGRRRSGEVLFAFCYDSCRIDQNVEIKRQQNGTVKVVHSKGFTVKPIGSSSCLIYCLNTIDANDTTSASQFNLKDIQKGLRTKELRLPLSDGEELSEVLLVAKMVQVDNNRWSASTITGGGESLVNHQEALTGVGLTIEGGATRVTPKPLNGWSVGNGGPEDPLASTSSMMSYSLCHSACLTSIKCRSFSLCSAGYSQPECLISEREFRDSNLLRQIQQATNSHPMGQQGSTITLHQEVQLDDDDPSVGLNATTVAIELRVDRRCHLYNKQALELFRAPERSTETKVRDRSLLPVDSVEQCAELCIKKNERYFRRANRRRRRTLEKKSEAMPDDRSFVGKVLALEGENLRSWCHSFDYYDLNERNPPKKLVEIIDRDKLKNNGLCHLSTAPLAAKTTVEPPTKPAGNSQTNKTKPVIAAASIPMHKYGFVYSSLYEPQYGRKLHPLRPESRFNELTADELRQFMRDGNNQAVLTANDVESCARICFLQSSHLEPWCQSFGFSRDKLSTEPRSYCILNSNTMEAVRKSQKSNDLSSNVSKDMLFIHYEPRNLLNLEGVLLNEQLLEEDGKSSTGGDDSAGSIYSQITILILFVLSLTSGFILAQLMSPHLASGSDNTTAHPEGDGSSSSAPFARGPLAMIPERGNRRFGQDMDLTQLVQNDGSQEE